MRCVRVGDVLKLDRRPVTIDPLISYELIGVYSFGNGIFHREPKLGAELGDYRYFAIEPGDLVLSNIQAWEGAIAHATDADQGCIASHRFLTYVPADGTVDTNYLRYYFLSGRGHASIRRASPGSVTRNRTLAIDRFEAIEFPLPDIDEQAHIASVLESRLSQARAIERQLAMGDPASIVALYPGIVERTLSARAKHWEPVCELADFANVLVRPGELTEPAESFVGLQHIEAHTGRRIGELPIGGEKGRKFRFQPGDIIYGYLRPYLNKVWVADIHGLCSVDQYVIRPKPGTSAAYLAHALRSRSTLDRAIELTHSLQLPRLRSGLLAGIELPVVRSELVDEVTQALDRSLATVIRARDLRVRQGMLIKGLRESVLNRAFADLL